jgi:putative transposase
VAVDALGNPVELVLTPGQAADVRSAEDLLAQHRPDEVVADKAYDSDHLIAALKARGIRVVIPPKKNRIQQRAYDAHVYKARHLVEQFVNRIKHYRRVATRYEKSAANYLAFVHVAAIKDLLR